MKKKPIVLTASSLSCLFTCPRKYYLSYVIGWRKKASDDALRFGTAFHKGVETWFSLSGKVSDISSKSISSAIATAGAAEFDAQTTSQLIALLGGYFSKWESDREKFSVEAEKEFSVKFKFLPGCVVCGKIDGVVKFANGRTGIIEHKTTSEDIGITSDYWQTINRDQVALYRAACEKNGEDVVSVIYDVIRKPTIRIGKEETAVEYTKRLLNDCTGSANGDNPRAKDYKRGSDFYFARREIPLLDCDMDALARRLFVAKKVIQMYKKMEKSFLNDGGNRIDSWPKCGSSVLCRFCQFKGLCNSEELPEEFWQRGMAFEELEIAKKYL